jgi:hypothetical protein
MVLPSCPICGCGPVEPVLTNKTVYVLGADGYHSIGKLQAYSCGANGHILILPAEGNGVLHLLNGEPRSVTRAKGRVLNSWKEIAAHLGRGVRTVQRWEQNLSLPIHRPRGKNRSAVVAFPEELDQWLHQTPVRAAAIRNDGAGERSPDKVMPFQAST